MTASARSDTSTNAIVGAINGLDESDLDRFNAWQPLADLSSATMFEFIDADPDSIVPRNGGFEAIATIYVTLVYGSRDDEERMSDEYVAVVRGHMENGGAMIDTIDVDASPFYT